MKWKDSDNTVELNAESDESPYDKGGGALKEENVPEEFSQSILQKVKSPFVIAGAGLIVLIVLLVVLLADTKKTVEIPQAKAFNSRIKALENRFANMEQRIEAANSPEARKELFDQLNNRVDRLEAAMNQQMDGLLKQLDKLEQQRVRAVASVKVPVPEKTNVAGQPSEATYHVVQKGENLYRISLRYGMKMDELLRLNKLQRGAVIQTGQKLMVRPQKGR